MCVFKSQQVKWQLVYLVTPFDFPLKADISRFRGEIEHKMIPLRHSVFSTSNLIILMNYKIKALL